MRKQISVRLAAFFAAGGFIATLFLGGTAKAITDTIFKYSSPKTGYVTIPASAFGPEASGQAFSSNGEHISNTSTGCYMAPVNNLPQGAELSTLAIWYFKSDASAVSFGLRRVKISDGTNIAIASVDAVNSAGAYRSSQVDITDPSFRAISNRDYFYYMTGCISTTEAFYGARLKFTYTTAGD